MAYKNLRNMVYTVPLLAGLSLFGSMLPTKSYAQEGSALEQKVGNKKIGDLSPERMLYEIGNDIGRNVAERLNVNPLEVKNPLKLNELNSAEVDPNVVDGGVGETLQTIINEVHHYFATRGGELYRVIESINSGDFHDGYFPSTQINEVENEGLNYKKAFLASYEQNPNKNKGEKIILTLTFYKDDKDESKKKIVQEYKKVSEIVQGYTNEGVLPYNFAELKEILEKRLIKENGKYIKELEVFLAQKYTQK